ncbi:MAG TPA: choice-of-anchor X domain-containing protein [Kofleriaceae bacterium]
MRSKQTHRNRRSTRRKVVVALAGAGLIAAFVDSETTGAANVLVSREASMSTHAAQAELDRSPAPRIDGLDEDMLSSRALREALAAYERDSVYPPSSHRWTEANAGERQPWNRPFPVEQLLDDRPGQETMFRFAGDRHHVEFGEALTSTIEVAPASRRGERMPVTIHTAIVEAAGVGRTGIALTYRDDGEGGDAIAGDRIYTNRFVPSEHSSLSVARHVRVQVELEAGGVARLAHLDFSYTPRPLLELTGVTTAARDGGLAISLAIEVFEPGAYRFDADVLAADGTTQIGWITEPWQELAGGRARVDLALFGKVLRDRGIAGPYVIANLRAERRDDDADVEMWWADHRTFRTPAFVLDAFSAEPWAGEERATALAAIQQAITEQERAEHDAAR